MKKKNTPTDTFPLSTGLAQKINAPLKSVLLSSQKLLDTYKSKDFEYISYKDFKQMILTLEQINRQIKHCYETTQRLSGLDQAKGKKEVCNINEVIEEVVALLKTQFSSSRIKISARLKKDVPQVALSRLDGHQIVNNILVNAVQAMPAGGAVKIHTSYDDASKSVLIDIADEGVGISPEHLSKVFEPFFTTHEHGVEKSSGLGLSIVYAIIEAAGGSINIQSSLRKGTEVRIFLPACRQASGQKHDQIR